MTTFLKVSNEYVFELGLTAAAVKAKVPVAILGAAPATFPFRLASRDGAEVTVEGTKQKTIGEVIEVTAEGGGEWTFTRGVEGTAAKEHAAGTTWELMIGAAVLEELQNTLNTLESHAVVEAGKATTQGIAGNTEKAGAEAAAFTLRPYPGSAGKVGMTVSTVQVLGFSTGLEVENRLIVTGTGGIESPAGATLGGTAKPAGVSLTQLAFTKIQSPAEIKENVKDYIGPNTAPEVWQRIKAKPNLAIFGIEHKELAEGKVFIFTNVGTNPIDIAGENTECPTAEDRFKIKANIGSNNFEATIAAGALTELKEVTNFRFLYPGSKVSDSGGVLKAGTTINSIEVAGKTAILSEAATGEHAKEVMTASYANIVTIGVDESVWIGYDTKSLRWRVIGGPSG